MPLCTLHVFAAAAAAAAGVGPRAAEAFLVKEQAGAAAGAASSSFEEYIRLHDRSYLPGSAEYQRRRLLFEQSVAKVERQNAQPHRMWSAAVNKLADRTDEELAALKGYSRDSRPASSTASANHGLQFLSQGARAVSLDALPQDFTWRSRLKATTLVRNQKSCGSCWAFASSTVLRAHSELYQKDRYCSVEQIVSCTPNRQHCGGDGGCKGATAELGMDYVARNGCVLNSDWEYKASVESHHCPQAESSFAESIADASRSANSMHKSSSFLGGLSDSAATASGLSFGLKGYTKLPENQLSPVMIALVQRGPVAVSVSVGSQWHMYQSGIMEGCSRDAVINHAVTLVGFGIGAEGPEQGQNYWQIQNSWGPDWGEGGFVRMARGNNKEEANYCGVDNKPEQGSGCQGGPPTVRICGTCGILYDTVIPDFQLGPEGLWSDDAFLQEHHRTVVGDSPLQQGFAGSFLSRNATSRHGLLR